jgi:hypothetical protein
VSEREKERKKEKNGPLRIFRTLKVSTSQTLHTPLHEDVAKYLPSGENEQDDTGRSSPTSDEY